jgi:hypothetical protein
MAIPIEFRDRPVDRVVRLVPGRPRYSIGVIGNRDPRGLDNTVHLWLTDDDELHIAVGTPDRCYRFKEIERGPCTVEVIQE